MARSNEKITFFYLRSQSPQAAWSFNTWKTRFVLNYKGLAYDTKWLEYPEIEPVLRGKLTDATVAHRHQVYTLPTIILPDGTYIMDSRKIASVIEEVHPLPSLHLESPYLAKVEANFSIAFMHSFPNIAAKIPQRILSQGSVKHWVNGRLVSLGMSLAQFENQYGGQKAFDQAAPAFQAVTALLEEQCEGPFFMGRIVSYADFVWAGFLLFLQCIGDDIYDEIMKRSGNAEVHMRLLEALKPWSGQE